MIHVVNLTRQHGGDIFTAFGKFEDTRTHINNNYNVFQIFLIRKNVFFEIPICFGFYQILKF